MDPAGRVGCTPKGHLQDLRFGWCRPTSRWPWTAAVLRLLPGGCLRGRSASPFSSPARGPGPGLHCELGTWCERGHRGPGPREERKSAVAWMGLGLGLSGGFLAPPRGCGRRCRTYFEGAAGAGRLDGPIRVLGL